MVQHISIHIVRTGHTPVSKKSDVASVYQERNGKKGKNEPVTNLSL
jgi:hypothetical protein